MSCSKLITYIFTIIILIAKSYSKISTDFTTFWTQMFNLNLCVNFFCSRVINLFFQFGTEIRRTWYWSQGLVSFISCLTFMWSVFTIPNHLKVEKIMFASINGLYPLIYHYFTTYKFLCIRVLSCICTLLHSQSQNKRQNASFESILHNISLLFRSFSFLCLDNIDDQKNTPPLLDCNLTPKFINFTMFILVWPGTYYNSKLNL